jgi:hypothetical protein
LDGEGMWKNKRKEMNVKNKKGKRRTEVREERGRMLY